MDVILMKFTKYLNPTSASCLVGLFILGAPANADAAITQYRLEWSGASFSNSVTAVAIMGIDLDIWQPNVFGGLLADSGVTDLTFTVGGATFGNGVYGMENFSMIILTSNGGPMDMTRELVGQVSTNPNMDPFGTTYTGSSGDFSLFGLNPTDPSGAMQHFTMAVGDGEGPGERMVLTSFAPTAVPEPASAILIGSSGLALLIRRRR